MATTRFIDIFVRSNKAKRDVDKLDGSMVRLGKDTDKTTKSMGSLTRVAQGVSAALVTRQVVQYADAYTSVQNQIRQTVTSTAELTKRTQQLLEVSNRSRTGISDTVDLYTNLTLATKQLGLSTEENLRITETISKSFSVSGKTAAESAGAIRQLGQALSSGALRGDEFNSIAEGAPEIMRALQRELGKTQGELRDFAATGGITAEIVVKSLQGAADIIDKKLAGATKTFAQSVQEANNNMTKFIGSSSEVQSIMTTTGEAIVFASNNFDVMASGITVVASVLAARMIPALATATAATIASATAASASVIAKQTEATTALTLAKAKQAETATTLAATSANLREAQSAVFVETNKALITGQTKALTIAKANETKATILQTKADQANIATTTAVIAAKEGQVIANRAVAASSTLAARATRGLASVMALVGGPLGVVVLAASAIFSYREELGLTEKDTRMTAEATQLLVDKYKSLSDNVKRTQGLLLSNELFETNKKSAAAIKEVERLKETLRNLNPQAGAGAQLLIIDQLRDAQDKAKVLAKELIGVKDKLDAFSQATPISFNIDGTTSITPAKGEVKRDVAGEGLGRAPKVTAATDAEKKEIAQRAQNLVNLNESLVAETNLLQVQLGIREAIKKGFISREKGEELARFVEKTESDATAFEAELVKTTENEAAREELRAAFREKQKLDAIEFQASLTEIEKEESDNRTQNEVDGNARVVASKKRTQQQAINLLGVFASKSKTISLVLLAIQKAEGIAQVGVLTEIAAARALAELGPIAGTAAAASIRLQGKLSQGLIAATGLFQAAAGGGSSGGGGGVDGGATTPDISASITPTTPDTGRLTNQIRSVEIRLDDDAILTGAAVKQIVSSALSSDDDITLQITDNQANLREIGAIS